MILIPVIKDVISKSDFFCTKCQTWLKINGSVKNIKRHIRIHQPEFIDISNNKQKDYLFSEKQELIIANKIILFVLLRTQCFQLIEDEYLKSLTSKLPSRNYLTQVLERISNATINEIKQKLVYSSSNYIIFDGWSSKNNTPYLGITIRSLINNQYFDYFLDLVEITSENQNAINIAIEISTSLEQYGLTPDKIISCTTDNCKTMICAAKELDLWRIPCTIHLLNLVFKTFVESSNKIIDQFISLINYLSRSTKYSIFVKKEQIKKHLHIFQRDGLLYAIQYLHYYQQKMMLYVSVH